MKKLRVGFDFDGVIAYNPVRVARLPISLFKRLVIKKTKLTFFRPKNKLEELLWIAVHETSIFPANGVSLLKKLVGEGKIEAHLITGRYSLLHPQLLGWLKRNGLDDTFSSLNLNSDLQPHMFKQQTIERLKLDIYIEDNLDIVKHLSTSLRTKVVWIYNLLDKNYPYPYKSPHLKHALEKICQ